MRLQLRFLGKQTRGLLASLQYFKDFLVPLCCRVRGAPGAIGFDQFLDLTLGGLPLLLFFIGIAPGRVPAALSDLFLANEVGVGGNEDLC